MRERYESGAGASRFTALDDEDYGEGTGFRQLPDATNDPKLWLMRCKPNHEKMLVRACIYEYPPRLAPPP